MEGVGFRFSPPSQVYTDSLGNLGVFCGYSYVASPTVAGGPFSGAVRTAPNVTSPINGVSYNMPSGRVPYVNFTYQMETCPSARPKP